MPRTKEEIRAYQKKYKQSPAGKKAQKIASWKYQGIIVEENDWDYFYDLYLSTTHCQICKKELTIDKRTTHSTRCADHDHNITDRPNVRYICCQACNANDNSKNTSGEPNINYTKTRGTWHFQKYIQGKRYFKSGLKTFEEAITYKKEFICQLKSSE
jgi:hypothetical protein